MKAESTFRSPQAYSTVGEGNVGLSDGSGQRFTSRRLQEHIRLPDPGGTKRLAFP
ncbi:MAG: hypothetical protein KDM81_20045 [Verrucomicrobiae bacterium]|nr:hypothetical protein [Verrucomicrobiae bacterium]MCP5524273.1 hypothetical protein [Verrucomicrobiales bacterium]